MLPREVIRQIRRLQQKARRAFEDLLADECGRRLAQWRKAVRAVIAFYTE